MEMRRILFLDDDQARHDAFARMVAGKSIQVDYVYTAQEAIKKLVAIVATDTGKYELVCLDHDLGGETFQDSEDPKGTGYTVAVHIAENADRYVPAIGQIIIHSFNPAGAGRMLRALYPTGILIERIPFGMWNIR